MLGITAASFPMKSHRLWLEGAPPSDKHPLNATWYFAIDINALQFFNVDVKLRILFWADGRYGLTTSQAKWDYQGITSMPVVGPSSKTLEILDDRTVVIGPNWFLHVERDFVAFVNSVSGTRYNFASQRGKQFIDWDGEDVAPPVNPVTRRSLFFIDNSVYLASSWYLFVNENV